VTEYDQKRLKFKTFTQLENNIGMASQNILKKHTTLYRLGCFMPNYGSCRLVVIVKQEQFN